MINKWAIIMLFLPMSATSEQIADWASSPTLPEKYKEAIEQFKKVKCIPGENLINLPVYRNSELFGATFAPEKPDCIPTKEWEIYGGIILVSYDDPKIINDWYRKKLYGFSEFSVEQGTLFIKGDFKEFDWNRDYPKYPNVLIMPAKEGIKEGSYETIIELNNNSF